MKPGPRNSDPTITRREKKIKKIENMTMATFLSFGFVDQMFVGHAPLTRVHQCVFGVLAMESEPVDPRL